MRVRWWIGWAMLLAVLLSACGSDGGGVASPADGEGGAVRATEPPARGEPEGGAGTDLLELDVCALVRAEEVAGIVGNSVGDGESLPLVCSWDSATLEDAAVTLGVIPSFGGEDPCAGMGAEDTVEVAGIGDREYWRFVDATGFNTGSLEVCLGELGLSAQIGGERDETTLRSATEELVRLVMERL